MRWRVWIAGLASVLLLSGPFVPVTVASSAPRIPASSPCGGKATPHYDHVVWIMLENVGYSVTESTSAPYLRSLAAACGLATQDYAVAHPSLPNYVALTSGSTQGITDDGEPSAHPLRVPSIFSELSGNWTALVESMPSKCDEVTSGEYAARHNPAVYYRGLTATCLQHDVPLSYPLNLSKAFTYIVPNVCNDMHSCPVATGDQWLRRIVPLIVASSQYQSRSLALFITFDENDAQSSNRVPTWVIAPSVPRGVRVSVRYSHYSLLRTSESLLHVPLLGNARDAPSMLGPFHL
ncbi:MAG TPA: alkaline phosphatase family protein [Acidimicrobiales bacterium]|nr:alkaline phosphatase family protein [Acidimicrobiales bacterium]